MEVEEYNTNNRYHHNMLTRCCNGKLRVLEQSTTVQGSSLATSPSGKRSGRREVTRAHQFSRRRGQHGNCIVWNEIRGKLWAIPPVGLYPVGENDITIDQHVLLCRFSAWKRSKKILITKSLLF